MLLQHDSGLVYHGAQRYLRAGQAPVKHRLQKKTRGRFWSGMLRNQLLRGESCLRTVPLLRFCPPAQAGHVPAHRPHPTACGKAGKRDWKGDAESNWRQLPLWIHHHGHSLSATTCLGNSIVVIMQHQLNKQNCFSALFSKHGCHPLTSY